MSGAITTGAGYSCTHWNNLPNEDQLKIFEALDRLANNNPEMPDLLMKLAELKEKKPLVYKVAVAKLKKM